MPSNGQGTTCYIPDGYTQEFYFAEADGIHGEVRGSFRPLSVMQHAAVNRDLSQAGDDWERRAWVAAKWIGKQVVNWDVRHPRTGELIDHTKVDEVMHMPNTLFTRTWNLVCNTDGGDIDPRKDPYEMRKQVENEEVIQRSDLTPQEALEKN